MSIGDKACFEGLDRDVKIQIVLNEGTIILDRIFLHYKIDLYALNDFYVELWCAQNDRRIEKIIVAELDDIFHLYDKRIDLDKLLNE